MLYPLLTLSDQTEMLYSEIKPDGRVKVYVEKPDTTDCSQCGLLAALVYLGGYFRLYSRRDTAL